MFAARKTLILAALTAATCAASPALAWGRHPRVNEVNGRLFNQQHRVNAGIHDGEMSRAETHQVRSEDRGIYREERAMRRLDGGHLTHADQRSLNQQENAVSRQIHTDRHN